jgi:hypothetical protein
MSDQQRRNNYVWDRFITFLYPFDETVTDAEIDADLKRLKIDMAPAVRKLHQMIETHRAKAQFAAAKETRRLFAERIRDVIAPKIDDVRGGIRQFIGRMLSGSEQLAYFHKLEGAASEEDLQSLMDDLEKLVALRELGNRHDTPSK